MTAPAAAQASTARSVATALLTGAGAAVLGLLPWLTTSMHLPLQNLWADPTLDMPVALLPFSQYAVLSLFAMMTVPGAVAGLAVRHRPGARPGRRAALVMAGLVTVMAAATAQTLVVVVPGLRPGDESAIYVAGITAVIVVSLGVSSAICRLLASGTIPAATIGAAAAAVAAGYWFAAFAGAGAGRSPALPPLASEVLHTASAHAPAVLTGLALAWCGWVPTRRLLAWAGALATLWLGVAVLEAILAVASTRAVLGDPVEMVGTAGQYFAWGLRSGWANVLTASLVGLAGHLVLRAWAGRPRARSGRHS